MLVSFVVPTYRRPDALAQTLDALLLLERSVEDFEVIVVDDGSGDGTADLVDSLTRAHPNLRPTPVWPPPATTAPKRRAESF
jgi:glycosyltransferase involved in cell wall biosynthesis